MLVFKREKKSAPTKQADERLRELQAKYRQGMYSGITEAEVLELVRLQKELKP